MSESAKAEANGSRATVSKVQDLDWLTGILQSAHEEFMELPPERKPAWYTTRESRSDS
jgi:hypothetical protein